MTGSGVAQNGRELTRQSSTPASNKDIGVIAPRANRTQRSPKGLLTIDNVGWDRERGLWLEEIGPDKLAIRGQDRKKSIVDYIAFLRRFASGVIEASGKKPADYRSMAKSDVLDRPCAAARMLVQLDIAEAHIRQMGPDGASLNAVLACLTLASLFHHLTVVDNEVAIATTGDRRKFLRQSRLDRTREADRERREDQKLADEIWNRRPVLSTSAVAEEIKKRRGGNAGTIRRRIQKQNKK